MAVTRRKLHRLQSKCQIATERQMTAHVAPPTGYVFECPLFGELIVGYTSAPAVSHLLMERVAGAASTAAARAITSSHGFIAAFFAAGMT